MTRFDPVSYLLGELDSDETIAFEAAIERDPDLRDQVEQLRGVMSGLERLPAEAWEPPTPPPLEPLLPTPRPPRRWALRPVTAAVCAVALLLAGAGVGLLVGDDGAAPEPAASELPLQPVADSGAAGNVQVLDDRAEVRLQVEGLAPAGRDGFYELWLLGAEGELVSLGSFKPDGAGAATVTLPLPVDPARFQSFDVSSEPGDGNPGHSGESVLRGPSSS